MVTCSGADTMPDDRRRGVADMLLRKTYDAVMNEPISFSDIDSQEKGVLKVQGEDGEREMRFMWAGFGDRSASLADVPAVLCDPDLADGALTNADQVKGSMAVVRRGANSFVEKAKRAQDAGAVGLIIINNADELLKAGGDDLNKTVTIPVVMVPKDAAAALTAAGTRVSLAPTAAAAETSGGDEETPASASLVLPMITRGVPLLPHEEAILTVPAGWAKALNLAPPGDEGGAQEGAEDTGKPTQVALFFADGGGEVGTVGTLAEIRRVEEGVGDEASLRRPPSADKSRQVPRRRGGADRVRVRVVATGKRILLQESVSGMSDDAPATVRCSPADVASFSYGGPAVRELLLKVAGQVPGGFAAQGGWEGAVAHVEEVLALAAAEETPLAAHERVTWAAASLLPMQPTQRQALLQVSLRECSAASWAPAYSACHRLVCSSWAVLVQARGMIPGGHDKGWDE